MNPFDLVKNLQDIQQQLDQAKTKLSQLRVQGSAGAGLVEVTLNGLMEVQSIHISPQVVDPSDTQTLQVLVASAFNAAVHNVQEQLKSEASLLSGLHPFAR